MTAWQDALELALTSLLSLLAVVVIDTLFPLRAVIKSRRRILIIFALLVLLASLIPIIISLSYGTLLSLQILRIYLKELLVSATIVISYASLRKVFIDIGRDRWLPNAGPFIVAVGLRARAFAMQLVYVVAPQLSLAQQTKRLGNIDQGEQRLMKLLLEP